MDFTVAWIGVYYKNEMRCDEGRSRGEGILLGVGIGSEGGGRYV